MLERHEEVNALFEDLCEMSETDMDVTICLASKTNTNVISTIKTENLIQALQEPTSLQSANDDPYSHTMIQIRQAIEHSLHPTRKSQMNEYEYQTLLQIRAIANRRDPHFAIRGWQ